MEKRLTCERKKRRKKKAKTKDQQFSCKMRINSHSLSSMSITKKQQMFTHVHT